MKEKELVDLTNEELLRKWKGVKSPHQISIATCIVAVLFTIIRAFVDGLSFSLLYLPLFIAIITITIWVNYKSVQEEMEARNLRD
jgi:hypothetical protein